jgi:hypothetical protein
MSFANGLGMPVDAVFASSLRSGWKALANGSPNPNAAAEQRPKQIPFFGEEPQPSLAVGRELEIRRPDMPVEHSDGSAHILSSRWFPSLARRTGIGSLLRFALRT